MRRNFEKKLEGKMSGQKPTKRTKTIQAFKSVRKETYNMKKILKKIQKLKPWI
jgi:hypothetical protein